MDLGTRLRQARLEAGLSQRQLCGEVITRNMLSLIENGSAKPSMETLRYLASKLGKPMGYFLEEQAVTSPNRERIAQARHSMAEGEYRAALVLLEDWQGEDPVFDPERYFLEALCCIRQAELALVENLQRMGITRIDHLVITHPHSDHQNGAFHQSNRKGNGVLDLFDIGKVYYRGGYDSKNMEASQLVETVCTQRNLPLEILEMGDTLQIGEVSIQVLWPAVGTSEKDTTGVNAAAANNASIVLRFDYQDHSALFTGDIYAEKEADLMELHGELLDVDLLKAPHHGNGITSNSEEFLAAVSPEIAVATGFENIQSRVAQRFTDVGATLLGDRTCGYIHITADGTDEMTYETSRQEALG